jgi:cytochrome b
MNGKRFLLWDLPTRLFHWLLVLAVIGAMVSGQLGGNLMVWHGRLGIAVVGLIAFRFAWGVLGSTYARFSQFFPLPSRIQSYLRGEWRGEGHNPLGALAVFGLLGLLTAQALTGLFANDDIAFTGPLFDLVNKGLSNRLTGLHHLLSNLLIAVVVLHVAAIGFYVHVKKQKLLKPMITGWKDGGEGESARGGGIVALVIALIFSFTLAYGASGSWLPAPPPPPPATATPDW